MARRSDHSREELQELAINAGTALIEEKGFSHFSARAVAAKIGYTVGTLYHLFGSLDDFILHINARTLDAWYAELHKGMKNQKGKNAVAYLAKGYLDFARRHPRRFMALFEHHLEEGREVPQWYALKMERFFRLVEEALMPQVKEAQKAAHLAKLLWASVHGICVLSLSGKLDVVKADSAENMIESLLASLRQAQQ